MLRAHRLARESQGAALSGDGANGASIDALTPAVYDDVPSDRHAWAKFTLRAHLIKLARDGKVIEHDGVWRAVGG